MNYDLLIDLLKTNYPSNRSTDGINWYKLGAAIKYSNTGVKHAIINKSLSVSMLELLANVLNVPVTSFFNDTLEITAFKGLNSKKMLLDISKNINHIKGVIDKTNLRQ